MSAADLVILNGRVATPSYLRSCAVAARGGKISWLGSNSNAPRGEKVIDASGLIVLPGVIDVHVHMREPGSSYKEDFRSGTAAAAAGGVTTIFDMPNNRPPTEDLRSLREKERAARKAVVDYALYGLLTAGNVKKIGPMVEAGVIGFKWYMAETTGNALPSPTDRVREGLRVVGAAGRRVAVHAEDDETIRRLVGRLRAEGRLDALAHYESRPAAVEEKAVREAIAAARASGCDLHLAHLSSAAGAAAVREAKRRGPRGRVTAETCPQYLLLDVKDYAAKGAMMKCNPSIKRRGDRLALWRAVGDGTVDMIATDHAPHALEEKTSGASIFEQASGFPGLETSVAIMLTCVHRGLLSLSRYVQLASEAPARAWGLYPRKGRIAVGSDADFTIVDAGKEWKIDPERFVSKARYSPFEGFTAKGVPAYTVVRGRTVMEHGVIDETPRGEMQKPA